METTHEPSFYLRRLKVGLAERQRKNPSYSLRAYSKFLGIQPPTLSAILNGKRKVPLSAAEKIADRLELSPIEKRKFLMSLVAEKSAIQETVASEPRETLDEQEHFQIIAEWEHYAILSLIRTQGFRSDATWIARRLGITPSRASIALDRLVRAGFLQKKNAKYLLSTPKLKTTEDIVSPALRRAHKETLANAAQKIETVPTELRDFSSISFPADPARLPRAKELLREFRRELAAIMESGTCSEVYELSIQLYPLTVLIERNQK